MPLQSLRLAILDADILRPELRPGFGSYGRMFRDLFARLGVDWHIQVYSAIRGERPASLDAFDAVLVTGSRYDAFADVPWIRNLRAFCRQCYAAEKPQVGICFGHQLLAHALGGRAERAHNGWGLGVMRFRIEDRTGFIEADTPIDLLVSHRDQVTALPPGARLLLANDFCPYGGFHIPGRVLCLQGHPEFDNDYESALLAHRENDVDPEQMRRIKDSLGTPHQGLRAGRWIQRFLETAIDGGAQSSL